MHIKLLLIGSECVHTYNYFRLIQSFFDEIVLITTDKTDFIDPKLSRKYVINSSLRNPFHYFSVIRKLRKIIAKEQPTIIHVQQLVTYNFLLLKANKKFRIPVISTAWGSDILVTPKLGWIYKKMVQYCIEQSDYLTADAQFLIDEMQKLSRKKIEVVEANFGITIPPTVPLTKENIIYSNRTHKPLYRIDEIIHAFSRFVQLEQYRDWQLVIASKGPDTASLKKLVEQLNIQNSVQFVGWLSSEENMTWYEKSKIWISLPESDATAISLLEAMSVGCIPIVTDLPAMREWIENKKNGILVSDTRTLNIEDAFSIDYPYLASYNRKMMENKASKKVNSDIFISIYQSIINKK